MDPIYLSSLTVGDLYHYDSLNRAINLRPSNLKGTLISFCVSKNILASIHMFFNAKVFPEFHIRPTLSNYIPLSFHSSSLKRKCNNKLDHKMTSLCPLVSEPPPFPLCNDLSNTHFICKIAINWSLGDGPEVVLATLGKKQGANKRNWDNPKLRSLFTFVGWV